MAMSKKDMIKEVGRQIVATSRACAALSQEIEKVRCTIEKLQGKRDKSRTQKTVQKNQELVDLAQQDLARLQQALPEAIRDRDAALARKQELDAQPDDPFLAIQSISRQTSMSATVIVRMMSGDILQVEVDLQNSIQLFPLQFAQQHQYNPFIAKSRMDFLIDEKTKLMVDEDGKERGSWLEEFKAEEEIPLINLLIHSEKEEERLEKIKLIRKILENKKWKTDLNDEMLYDLYSEWNLHYLPPPNSNRYLNLTAFLESNREHFLDFDEEDLIAFEYNKNFLKISKIHENDQRIYQGRRRYGSSSFILQTKASLQRILQQNPNHVFTRHETLHYRYHLTIQELIDCGVTSEQLFTYGPDFVQLWKQFFPSS